MPPRIKIMPPKRGNDPSLTLVKLQQDLADAERELQRLKNDAPNVRGRLKKILDEEDRIAVIKNKLNNASQTQQSPEVQTMLGSPDLAGDSQYCSKDVKKEIVEMVLQNSGRGTREMPLDVDFHDMGSFTSRPDDGGRELYNDQTTPVAHMSDAHHASVNQPSQGISIHEQDSQDARIVEASGHFEGGQMPGQQDSSMSVASGHFEGNQMPGQQDSSMSVDSDGRYVQWNSQQDASGHFEGGQMPGQQDSSMSVDLDGHHVQWNSQQEETTSEGPQLRHPVDIQTSGIMEGYQMSRASKTVEYHQKINYDLLGQQFLHARIASYPLQQLGDDNVQDPIGQRMSVDNEDILSRASTSVFNGQPHQDMTEGSMIPERTQIQLGSGLSGMDQVSEPMANTTLDPRLLSLSRGTYDPEKYESPWKKDGQGTRDVQGSSSQLDGVLPGDSIIAVNRCDDNPLNGVQEGQRPREASLPVVGVELGDSLNGVKAQGTRDVQAGSSSKSGCDGPMGWGWDLTIYDPKTGLYSFHLEDCEDEAATDTEPAQEEGETEETSLERQRAAALQAKVDHFEQQRGSLVKQQQSLIDTLSKGFNGDLEVTANHIRAINQSVKDIRLLEEHIQKHRKSVQESRIRYLNSCNKDDRASIELVQKEIEGIKYRLETVDPELFDLRLEQTSLRNARTRLETLKDAVSTRDDELEQYADVEEELDRAGTKNVRQRGKTPRGNTGAVITAMPQRKPVKQIGQGRMGKGKGVKKTPTPDEDVGNEEWSDEEAVKGADSEAKAAKALEKWLRDHKDNGFSFTYRKLVREDVKFLPKAVTTTIDLVPVICASKRNKRTGCEYHRKGKKTAYKSDSAFELQGQVGRAVGEAQPMEGHLHCGCPIAEVALELFFWKTSRAFSSNPANSGNVYQMSALHMLKPSIRSFWNQSIRDYTGLCTEDFLAPDYGESSWAARIALIQLHTQIERLRLLGVPFEIDLKFKDQNLIGVPEGVLAYGIEDDVVMTYSVLEELWKKIEERPVRHIPMVT